MSFHKYFGFLKRAPAVLRVADEQVPQTYRHYRIQAFYAVYIGYALFYIIRRNIAPALPLIMKQFELSKAQMGVVLSLFGATYALAKLVNGPICDRSNPRYFMAVGLGGAVLANFFFGLSSSILFFMLFWIFNGYFQSMGSPIGPKTIANWFSSAERGRYYGIWNTCHNFGAFSILLVGGFIVERLGWRFGFFIPAAICAFGAFFIAWKMLDRPESVGLPPIQEYHGDVPKDSMKETDETAVQIMRNYVLKNGRMWVLAFACMLIYMVRYGLGDWGVTYLHEVKASSVGWASFESSFLELMGIPGTILAGYLVDKVFNRHTFPVAIIYLAFMCAVIFVIFLIPRGHSVLDAVAFGAAGFFIYGAQMISTGLAPLEMVPRKAVASAVGLTGAMSYFGAVITSTFSGLITVSLGW